MFPFNELVYGSLLLLISYQYLISENADRALFLTNEATITKIPEYDFIIVGAGSAGCVVANRLSENYTVLILEVGGDTLDATYVPAHGNFLSGASEITHTFHSVPQKFEGLAKTGIELNKELEVKRMFQGKALGGSSVIDGMTYNRGHPKDYNRWADITGDPTWRYDNILKFFKGSEKHHVKSGQVKNDQLGYDGNMNLIDGTDLFEEKDKIWEQTWRKAGLELGYKEYSENGPPSEGFGSVTENKLNGRRVTAFDAFLAPIKNRNNLKIEKFSEATQIKFDNNGKAYGVLYKRHGINMFAKASKEIILSAGAFNSPKILMNSGIGPEKQLTEAKIPVISNLPVGATFQDHALIVVSNFIATKNNLPFGNMNYTDSVFEEYSKNGRGPISLTTNGFAQACVVSSISKKSAETSDWPDMSFYGFYTDVGADGHRRLNMMIQLSLVKSFGHLSLNTTNPLNTPLIWNPNYFQHENDVAVFREALQIAVKIYETKAFSDLGLVIDKTPIPRCSKYQFGSDMYWNCYMNGMFPNYHPTSTCPMGKSDDSKTVVDSKLRVLGVRGLRVIDNSIQPILTNAASLAAAMMIGQKGAQDILNELA